jgi:hypothetical protein
VVEAEKELAAMCSNWQQFHLLTRRKDLDIEEEEEREPTRHVVYHSENNFKITLYLRLYGNCSIFHEEIILFLSLIWDIKLMFFFVWQYNAMASFVILYHYRSGTTVACGHNADPNCRNEYRYVSKCKAG